MLSSVENGKRKQKNVYVFLILTNLGGFQEHIGRGIRERVKKTMSKKKESNAIAWQ